MILGKLAQLIDLHNGRCFYCDIEVHKYDHVQGKPPKYNTATIDHKIPKVRGGSNDISNLALSCWECNNMKGQLTVSEFKAVIGVMGSNKGSKVWSNMDNGHEVACAKDVSNNQTMERADSVNKVTDRALVSWLRNKHGIDTNKLKEVMFKEGLVDGINTQENFIKGSDGYIYTIKSGKVSYVSKGIE